MSQMKRTLIEKNSYSVSNSYIQKKTTKRTNRESFQQKKNKKNIKPKKNKQRNPKIRSFNYAKRWLYLQKKQRRFSNQTNQKKKKGQFLFAICVKKSLIQWHKNKRKKEQIFRENIYRHQSNQIVCLIITFQLR